MHSFQPFKAYAQGMAQTPSGPPNHFGNLVNENSMNYTAGGGGHPALMDATYSLISEVPSYYSGAARSNIANVPGTSHSYADPMATISTPSKQRKFIGTDGNLKSVTMTTPMAFAKPEMSTPLADKTMIP